MSKKNNNNNFVEIRKMGLLGVLPHSVLLGFSRLT
jgi:hypothetical protein